MQSPAELVAEVKNELPRRAVALAVQAGGKEATLTFQGTGCDSCSDNQWRAESQFALSLNAAVASESKNSYPIAKREGDHTILLKNPISVERAIDLLGGREAKAVFITPGESQDTRSWNRTQKRAKDYLKARFRALVGHAAKEPFPAENKAMDALTRRDARTNDLQ